MPPYGIALAEDHAMIREIIKKAIEEVPGLQVVGEFGDGRELPAFLESSTPDMVIVDLTMPHLGGTRLLPNLHRGKRVAQMKTMAKIFHGSECDRY